MNLTDYLNKINQKYKSGIAKEHAYRGELEQIINELVPSVNITNEPANVTDCGNPDYVITKGKIPIGYIEAKDIGKDLNSKGYKEQFDRYKKALDNLIITDYTWFQFFQHGELVHEIRIAQIEDGLIKPIPENLEHFENLIQDFCSYISQTIKSPKKLAKMMAAKARLLQNILESAITSDEESQENTSLKNHFDTFKQILIHDLKPSEFSDIYAQTLAYGMFAARIHDTTLDDFSRQEAAELIPQSNPFLRKLFQYIAGYDIDERIKSTVNNLADVFRATNVEAMLHNFGKSTQTEDPIIHFYETFLTEYDPKLRKARGVWYTPQPVVNFIVRAVNDILKSEFGLSQGLADVSKTKIKVEVQGKNAVQEFHRVQILDPATGTGTFLAETIRQIYSKFKGQQGIWSNYVETHLLPRLNGFELLMASYAMAHLKLDLLLNETGYSPSSNQRLKVFLTNSLEEYHPDTGTLFANWLSVEANEANHIKRDTPVMCIIGNPPYSGESANKGDWIMNLMEDYKKEPNSKEKLNERNSKSINDDYVKFLRYGQHLIEKNGSGILAFINPHGFLDNPTYRGMRWSLLRTYDKIYTLDLHGNSKKKETAPDGSADVNVFDIMQGVSINLFIKTGKKKTNELGKVFHFNLFGKREVKYKFLKENSIESVKYNELVIKPPSFYFVNKDFSAEKDYNKGFAVTDLFPFKSSGIKTHDDKNLVSDNKLRLVENVIGLEHEFEEAKVFRYSYRPFDTVYIYYDPKILGRAREKTIYHLKHENLGLILVAQPQAANLAFFDCVYLTDCLTDTNMYRRGGPLCFPLYLYPETGGQQTMGQSINRTINLNTDVLEEICKKSGLTYSIDRTKGDNSFAPTDILDYIYSVLYSSKYREKYKELLMIDFPRVPYPKDKKTFWHLVNLGGKLRQIHLMESPSLEHYITQYPVNGDNIVSKISAIPNNDPHVNTDLLRAYINETQYFENVPEVAWNFYIGGYQPAQKWLKDRKGRKLEFDDILHYQKIIVALTETDRLMKEIDKLDIE